MFNSELSDLYKQVLKIKYCNITAPPELLPFTFGDKALNPGQTYTVTCTAIAGDKPLTTKWYFNGLELSSSAGLTIVPLGDAGALLAITSIRADHAGNYSCIVENVAGKVSHTAELNVAGTI